MQNHKCILIDTDIGDDVDDALAIALALRSPEIEIKAITTVFKNTSERARLAHALLDTFHRTDIMVYEGTGRPIINEVQTDEIPCQCKVTDYDNYRKHPLHAADVIIRTLEEEPETIIVAIGPLTNIALAVMKAPEIMAKAEIYMMGGAFGTTEAEWNIYCDPEAASVVFRSGARIRIFGLDVTVPCALSKENMERIGRCGENEGKFLSKLMDAWQSASGYGITLHDALTIAALIRPELIQYDKKRVVVELRGENTRAATIVKQSFFQTYEEPNVEIASSVKKDEFITLFMDRVFPVN